MPEYLAPGVYVEEVPSGSKPIEGVSTSTAGMVGVTARGPVSEPTLVTSFAGFSRRFGGYLDHRVFTNGRDLLPYAAEGFFTNGGQRLYVTRIVGENATFAEVDLYGVPQNDPASTTLARRLAVGEGELLIDDAANIGSGDTLLLLDGTRSEYVTATTDPTATGIRLNSHLHHDHADGEAVVVQTVTDGAQQTVTGDMSAGGGLDLDAGDVAGLSAGDILRVRDTDDDSLTEYVTIATDGTADLVEDGLLFDHPQTTTEVHLVTMADDTPSTTLDGAVSQNDSILDLANAAGFAAGDTVVVGPAATPEFQVVRNVVSSLFIGTSIRLNGRLHGDHADGEDVVVQTVTDGAQQTVTGDMSAGGGLALDAGDVAGLSTGDILRVRDTADDSLTEYVTIATDATVDLVEDGLLFDHPQATTEVHLVTMADDTPATTLDGDVSQNDSLLTLADVAGFGGDVVVRVGTGGTAEFQVVQHVASDSEFIHSADIQVIKQVRLLRVHARHEGQWANSLRVRIQPASILETTISGGASAGDSPIELGATFGLGTGSVLAMTSGDTTTRQRVANVNVAQNEVDFDGGVAVALNEGDEAVSVEFDLIVEQLDADDKVVLSEAFAGLGMDPDHNRYAPQIVGVFDRASGEPERAGESELIRLSDLTQEDDGDDLPGAADLRLSIPSDAVDRHLDGGDDDLATIDDDAYIGAPADDPDLRTGIYTLENIDDISIVAVPGRTSQDVQNAIINHCTGMRYRFGVLDSERGARLSDVQKQRQLYDTTYGAFYYPWLVIGDPFGRNGDVHYIPPSGHVVGIYARSDNQRGVHKAPANEVVLGIRDLEVRLTKGEQDILNPKHINALRDFRDMNRGLRVWGARTLSSDPEWKYVNVRRLFLFVEKSIEQGTQFAVFEPNAEPLWATIRRSVSNFLTAVWRDGALEGTTQEEAFFVKVDRTTMTENDIANGRLIILVGIAPVKPAEFVIFRIRQKTREATG
jgi:phage tail sheath protein FI